MYVCISLSLSLFLSLTPCTDVSIAQAAAASDPALQQQLEEYFDLDYEDIVGGIPTRFKYVMCLASPPLLIVLGSST